VFRVQFLMPRGVFLIVLLTSGVLAAQNSPAPRVPLGSASGQVVLEGAGTPLRKVQVTLVPSEGSVVFSRQDGREPKSGTTDSDGRFQIDQVQPGEYRVTLERNGFLGTNRRSRRYSSTLLSFASGQELQGLLFRMRQAGVIKGKVVDEDGDPVPEMNVVAISASAHDGASNSDGTTNDLGEFRIAGLSEGRFFVLAQPQQEGNSEAQRMEHAPTYYPGTLDQSQAASVEVHAGDESTANFSLISSRTFTVRGQVFGLAQRTAPTLRQGSSRIVASSAPMVMLERAENTQIASANLEEDGSFEIQGVLPGSYTARINSGYGSRLRATPTIEVRDADVSGVQLTVEPAVEVRGRFRMDNGQKLDWRQVQVILDPEDRKQADTARVARVQQDGLFAAQDVQPGTYHVVVTSNSSSLRDYIVKEVNASGKDVGDSGFAVGNAAPFLDVVGSAKGATIEGVAVDDTGKPVADVQIVCFPDVARRNRRDVYQQVQTDQRGYFSLRGLNPGEYQVLALDDAVTDITDPDFVAAHEAEGETVTIEGGERKAITLKLPAPAD
jgi:Carboxypeptidase regulatory-like domain